ncbi:hypothetical protein AVEN_135800-1, partial [Araneus ventricosus]
IRRVCEPGVRQIRTWVKHPPTGCLPKMLLPQNDPLVVPKRNIYMTKTESVKNTGSVIFTEGRNRGSYSLVFSILQR